jgi:hypothetical protein
MPGRIPGNAAVLPSPGIVAQGVQPAAPLIWYSNTCRVPDPLQKMLLGSVQLAASCEIVVPSACVVALLVSVNALGALVT